MIYRGCKRLLKRNLFSFANFLNVNFENYIVNHIRNSRFT